MVKYELIFDYRDNKHYNNELINLIKKNIAKDHTKSSYELWMTKKKWDENYLPFALINEKGDIVCNIGVMKMNAIFDNKKYQVIQLIGKIVREGYEDADVDSQLVRMIIEKYENVVDAIYSYDESIKYLLKQEPGFEVLKEHIYIKPWNPERPNSGVIIRKVNTDSNKGLDFLHHEIKHSTRLSPVLWTSGDASIKVYNILKYFRRNVYFIPSKNVVVIFIIEDDIFTLVSVYSKSSVNLRELLDILVPQGINKVVFAFAPEWDGDDLLIEEFVPSFNLNSYNSHELVIKFISRPLYNGIICFPMLSKGF